MFCGDPCSLYADDIALFLSDLSQLGAVIKHIDWVRQFTGLHLNLSKTIAFDPEIIGPLNKNGIVMQNSPVKYLGTYLSLGNLSKLNFEQPLRKAKKVLNHWSKRTLTLDGQILVLKMFVVSLFIHVLNTTFISTTQIDLIQKLCINFL